MDQHGARFRVRWTFARERQYRTFASEGEAREFLERLRAKNAARADSRISGALTVMDVVQNWYEHHRTYLSPGTQRDYEGRIRRDIGRIGSLSADELAANPRRLRAFYATLTPTNARRLHAILRQAFQDALDQR